mgnify:CR=1 FL=1
MSLLSRLKQGLSRSSNKLVTGISDIFTKRKLDDEAIEELEELLILSDLGPETSAKIISEFAKNRLQLILDSNTDKKTSNELYHLKYLKDSVSKFEVGKKIIIDSMIFEPNSTVVPEKSFEQLAMIVAAIKANKTLKLEISGHTDRSGLDSLNVRLSKERAEAVYNHLISKGADKKRLSHQGYGSTVPIASNKYKWGRDKNRRVELKIIEK